MGLWAVKVKAFVENIPVALLAVCHVVAVDVLNVHPVPTGRELYVDFQLSASLDRKEAMLCLLRRAIPLTSILVLPLAVKSTVAHSHCS